MKITHLGMGYGNERNVMPMVKNTQYLPPSRKQILAKLILEVKLRTRFRFLHSLFLIHQKILSFVA